MATDTVAKNPAQDAVGQSAPMTAEQITAAIKAIPQDVINTLFAPATIVNNLPEEWQKILNMGAECQGEFSNPTDYKVDALQRFIRAGVKADARNVVVAWDNTVSKYSKTHAKLSREDCVVELLKMRSNKDAQEKTVLAAAVLVELK